ncbi:hypothetical protein D3C73_1394340 [compost metagenome]
MQAHRQLRLLRLDLFTAPSVFTVGPNKQGAAKMKRISSVTPCNLFDRFQPFPKQLFKAKMIGGVKLTE